MQVRGATATSATFASIMATTENEYEDDYEDEEEEEGGAGGGKDKMSKKQKDKMKQLSKERQKRVLPDFAERTPTMELMEKIFKNSLDTGAEALQITSGSVQGKRF
jgi:hypothetical protein